jgi:hypothetical protein
VGSAARCFPLYLNHLARARSAHRARSMQVSKAPPILRASVRQCLRCGALMAIATRVERVRCW